jgi:hypothetical protein
VCRVVVGWEMGEDRLLGRCCPSVAAWLSLDLSRLECPALLFPPVAVAASFHRAIVPVLGVPRSIL